MLKDLLVFWWEIHEPWMNGPFFDGWIIPLILLAWPVVISYGISFELCRRKKTAYLPWLLLPGIVLFAISSAGWYLMGNKDERVLLYLLTLSLSWLAGVAFYMLPSFLWNRKKKLRR